MTLLLRYILIRKKKKVGKTNDKRQRCYLQRSPHRSDIRLVKFSLVLEQSCFLVYAIKS